MPGERNGAYIAARDFCSWPARAALKSKTPISATIRRQASIGIELDARNHAAQPGWPQAMNARADTPPCGITCRWRLWPPTICRRWRQNTIWAARRAFVIDDAARARGGDLLACEVVSTPPRMAGARDEPMPPSALIKRPSVRLCHGRRQCDRR